MMERDDVAIDDVVLYDSADCPECKSTHEIK